MKIVFKYKFKETLRDYNLSHLAESLCARSDWESALEKLQRDLREVIRRTPRRVKSPYSRDVCQRPCQHMSRFVNKRTLLSQLDVKGNISHLLVFSSHQRHLGEFSYYKFRNNIISIQKTTRTAKLSTLACVMVIATARN